MRISRAVVFGVLFFAPQLAKAQSRIEMTWTRTEYEQGVSYPKQEFAKVTVKCRVGADNYSGSINWGDGPAQTMVTTAVGHTIYYNGANRFIVDEGTYSALGTDHVFTGPVGPHDIVAHRTNHCLDDPGTEERDFKTSVMVRPRTPIKEVDAKAKTVKGGEPFEITVILTDKATAAKARVDLKVVAGLAALDSPPTSAEVVAGDNTVTFKISTKKTKIPHPVTLQVSTLGKPNILHLRVNPS